MNCHCSIWHTAEKKMNMSPIRWRDTLDMPTPKNEHGNGKTLKNVWLLIDVHANYRVFILGNEHRLCSQTCKVISKFVCIQIHKFFIIYYTYIHLNNYLLFLSLLIMLRSMKTIDPHARANASIKEKKIERERRRKSTINK
jgi:hypothetical protein